MNNYIFCSLTLGFYDKDLNAKIKGKFGPNPYFWQISMVVNIAHYKKDVFIIARTNIEKNLIYQSHSEVIEGIIFVISLIIAFVEDQTK